MSKKRIILAKVGLDSHDNGLRIVAKWLTESGYEVIYAGVYNSPVGVVKMAVQENVDAIGVSFLGGGHLYYSERLLQLMKDHSIMDVALIAGGVIPPEDAEKMRSMGVQAILTPGTRRNELLEIIASVLGRSERRIR